MPNVILIVGYPASSKSSLRDQLLKNMDAIVLNRDTEGGTIASLLPKMENHLKNDKNIILDNLFATIESRKPFIELAKKYKANIECKLMMTSIEDSQFNCVQRAIKILGKFPTPEVIKEAKHTNIFPPLVLFRYKKEFQKPTFAEGFSSIEEIPFSRIDDPTFINKALILDYDQTLRDCVGGNGKYPVEIDQIKIRPNCSRILKEYKDKGYILLGISNQSGIARGDLTYEKAIELFNFTNEQLGVDIDYAFCPHQSAPISCFCRKPQVGLFVHFMMKYKLSRKDTIFVGDMTSDKTMAKRCGIQYFDQKDFFNGNW